jgi:hypothetical protein
LWLPQDAARGVRRIYALVADAEAYCRAGKMLTLPSSDDVWRLRAWIRDEVVEQLQGAAPRPCPL